MTLHRWRVAAVALSSIFVLAPTRAPLPAVTPAPRSFTVGWYDQLYGAHDYTGLQNEGANTLLPYGTGVPGIGTYLTQAAKSGLGVYVEIDPSFVQSVDVVGLTSFVQRFKDYPALRGWYLADEPTLWADADAMTPATGEVLYNAIKAADPAHPVAIAFWVTEDAHAFRNAMDDVFWDDYPCQTGQPEFSGLASWRQSLVSARSSWGSDHRFLPIVQAFGATGTKYADYRLPTAAEERYMIYTALQAGVNGMFLWAHYAAGPAWLTSVLDPLMAQVSPMFAAVARGPIVGVSSSITSVSVGLFRDATTGRSYVIAVHNGPGSVTATIGLPTALARLRSKLLVRGRLRVALGSYGAIAYAFDRATVAKVAG